ncbi:MAG: hypothetical protein ABR575_08125 [Actinomycetota bacterium]|nr:hypothetical protein [Actinomycetota bacterium]
MWQPKTDPNGGLIPNGQPSWRPVLKVVGILVGVLLVLAVFAYVLVPLLWVLAFILYAAFGGEITFG